MQNNSPDVELQRTLNELCTDLFATSALDDCNAILQSLALLAETFPQAQSLLGRLLSRNEDNQDRSRYVAVSTNFLYKKETARSTVSLLATLANDNVRNQRRIVQSVTGVKLDITPSKYGRARSNIGSTLYALTVPASVTSTYRRWRKRQRELQNCRLPSGVPPVQDGIPMPCYCDDCLGAEQFRSTWQQHFHDLSRWSLGPDKETFTSTCRPPSSLSTEEFFRMFLADYQLHECTVVEALGNRKEAEGSYADRANRHQSLVYYFVSPEEVTAATPRTQVQFNPLHHLSAIAIVAEVDIVAVRKAQLKPLQPIPNERSSPDLAGSSTLATEHVILFTSISDVESCVEFSPELPKSNGVSSSRPHLVASSNGCLLAAFSRLEEQHGQLAQCDSLVSKVSGENSELAETTRQLLLYMLSFCDSGDQIPLSAFRRNFCDLDQPHVDIPCQIERMESVPLNARTVMTAKLPEQVMQIDCFPTTAENSPPCSFSTRIPQKELIGMSSTTDNGGLSLLYLSDEALESLLQHCRICTCGNHESHVNTNSVIYLRLVVSEGEGRVFDLGTSDDVVENLVPRSGNLQNRAAVRIPLSGFSSEAKRDLVKLESFVSEERYRRLTAEGLTTLMEKLAKVVAGCNERISYLSIARDKELVRAATEAHRAAAISRCRHCRDLLIQLGKKLALKVKPLDILAPIPQDKLLRVAKLVRASIHDVLIHSETFDPWETPDARVEKLQLDHRIWASGFPDVAYYQDTDVRQRENRKKQQQLSRKLLLQQKKKQSKDDARARQRREQ